MKTPRRWLSAWRRAPIRTALEAASRLGYAARGAVYVSVGAIALLAAIDRLPRAAGVTQAIQAWAAWRPGLALIALVGVGLVGFAIWRLLQAAFDADRHGRSLKGLAVRGGQAISGVAYGALALSAFELLDGLEDVREADERGDMRQVAAEILALPQGDWLLLCAGLAVLGVGLGNLIQGGFQDFGKRLGCSERVCRVVVPVARIGYAARGLAMLPAGLFLAQAGLAARATPARSWGEALQILEQQPFGSWILGGLALGLTAFGLFGFVETWFRRIAPPREIRG